MSAAAFTLDAEQLDAIRASGTLLVKAGAGSGKTEVLARRFVALICGDLEGQSRLLPRQIAALTFTEKAAREMRQRIATALEKRLDDCADDDLHSHLMRSLALLPLARISTFHSFCATILRENAFNLGLSPDFTVLDEYDYRAFLDQHVRELLLDAVRNRDKGARHLTAVRNLASTTYRLGAIDQISENVIALHRLGQDGKWLAQRATEMCEKITARAGQIDDVIKDLARSVDRLIAEARRNGALTELEAEWPGLRSNVLRKEWRQGADEFGTLRKLADLIPHARGKLKGAVLAVRGIISETPNKFGLTGQLIEAIGEQLAIDPMRHTAELVARIADALAQQRRADGLMSYDDLLQQTRRLLQQPAHASTYRAQLTAVLVDEFQDTDPTQGEIIRLLTDVQEDLPTPELFVVGDEKQSIYRFRGADVTVFKRAEERVPAMRVLKKNRRAVPELIKFTNTFAETLFEPGATTAADFWVRWSDDHALEEHRSSHDKVSPVEVLLLEPTGERGILRQPEAIALANRFRAMLEVPIYDRAEDRVRPARFGDMTVLMRSFQDVRIYEQALAAAGIPYYTVQGRGFFEATEVVDAIDLMAAVDDHRNSISLAAALRSPFFMLSDDCLLEIAALASQTHRSFAQMFERGGPDLTSLSVQCAEATNARQLINELRDLRGRISVADLLDRAIDGTRLRAVVAALNNGPQRLANLDKLTLMVRDFESRSLAINVIDYLRRLAAEPPLEAQAQIWDEGQDVVRLMTIHQAKGLEFPIVVVADLGRLRPQDPTNYLMSATEGLLVAATDGSGEDQVPAAFIERHRELLKEQQNAEEARLLYVAMTRARDRLLLSAGSGHGDWRKKLLSFIGQQTIDSFLTSREPRRAISMADFAVVLIRADTELRATVAEKRSKEDGSLLRELSARRTPFSAESSEIVVSPTELADFDRCPRQYFFRHLQELPERAFVDGTGNAADLGIIGHATLQNVNLSLRDSALRSEVEHLVDAHAAGLALKPQERSSMIDDLCAYLASVDDSESIIGREVPFWLAVPKDGFAVYVRGQIDALIGRNESIVVRDYKYSSHHGGHAEFYGLQMAAYGLATMESWPGRNVSGELIFLRGTRQRHEIEFPSPDAIRARIHDTSLAINRAIKENSFPKKPAGPDECRALGCGYVARCWYS